MTSFLADETSVDRANAPAVQHCQTYFSLVFAALWQRLRIILLIGCLVDYFEDHITVVAAYLYRNGQRVREVAISEKVDCAADRTEFVWIGVADPSEEELRTLQKTYDLHPLAIEDALKADQLPKDIYGDQIFVVGRTAYVENDQIAYGEIYGNWNTIYSRFRRWSEAGVWEAVSVTLAEIMADSGHYSFDSTTVRAHVSAAGGLPDGLNACENRGAVALLLLRIFLFPPAIL